MLRLRALGGLWLERDTGPLAGAAAQRRRLALLSVLAAAGGAGASRDTLATLFWPESDADHAAGALRQLIHLVRQVLPPDAVVSTAQELRLNSAVVASDVTAFDAAVAAGAHVEAVALYAGPFLDGFHLPDAPEFERWADAERRRRAEQARAALAVLADEAGRAGDREGAVARWRALAGLEPLDSGVALALMRALNAAGNRPGALQHARVHEALVRDQLGTAPDSAVLAYAERLRTAPTVDIPVASASVIPHTPATADPEPASTGSEPAHVSAPSTEAPAGAGPDPAARPPQVAIKLLAASTANRLWSRRLGSRKSASVAGAVLALVAVLVAALARTRRTPSGTAPGAPPVVAVFPFTVRGDPDLSYLGPGMVDLLSTDLDGAGALRAADPRAVLNAVAADSGRAVEPDRARRVAERLGAGLYVLGDVTGAAGRVRLTAALYDRRQGGASVAHAAVEGKGADLLALVDRLTASLLAEQYRGPKERLTRTALLTTNSLPALKAYLAGERELRAWRFSPAVEAFQRAVAEDTSFALAYYRLGIAADNASRSDLAVQAAEQASHHADRLSEHDRLLVEGLLAWRRDSTDRAEHLYRTVVVTYPDDVEAWFQLGEVLYHKNAYRGRSFVECRGPFARVLALEPGHPETLTHLLRVAAFEGRRAEFYALLPRVLAHTPEPNWVRQWVYGAFAFGDTAAQERAVAVLRTGPDEMLHLIQHGVGRLAHNLDGSARLAHLMTTPTRPPALRAEGYVALARLDAAHGQWRAAAAELARAGGVESPAVPLTRGLLAALPFLAVPSADVRTARDELRRWQPTASSTQSFPFYAEPMGDVYAPVRTYLLGLLSLRLREVHEATRDTRTLDSLAAEGPSPRGRALARSLSAGLRAEVAGLAGRPADALAQLERAPMRVPDDLLNLLVGISTYERYQRAEALRALGRVAEALPWYGSVAEALQHGVVYLAPVHRRQGEAAERRGDRAGAAAHYAQVVALWRDADPALRPEVAAVERRLASVRP